MLRSIYSVDPSAVQLAQVGDGNDECGNNDRDDSQELEEPEAVVDVGPDPLAGRQQVWSLLIHCYGVNFMTVG